MDAEQTARAQAAAIAVARSFGLDVDDTVVLQNANNVALRLVPCETFARVALIGREVAEFEVALATALAVQAPIARLDPRLPARVHHQDGFAVTLWQYHQPVPEPLPAADYANTLAQLHQCLAGVDLRSPHFTDRVAEAQRLVSDPTLSPDLTQADRDLLLSVLREGREVLTSSASPDQLLHGEPHPGNVLNTEQGALFIDLETCCRGPVEFDLAHAPEAVADHYPNADPELVDESRRLILAMVAAWRWDADDQFPDGRRHGLNLLRLLREGPPWPSLGLLTLPE